MSRSLPVPSCPHHLRAEFALFAEMPRGLGRRYLAEPGTGAFEPVELEVKRPHQLPATDHLRLAEDVRKSRFTPASAPPWPTPRLPWHKHRPLSVEHGREY